MNLYGGRARALRPPGQKVVRHPEIMKTDCSFMKSRVFSSCRKGEQSDMATLQVKGFDEALYKALGARAKRENRSISQEVVKLVQDFLARPGGSAEEATHAFLELCGSWEDMRSSRQIAQDIRKSRRTSRRFRGVADVLA